MALPPQVQASLDAADAYLAAERATSAPPPEPATLAGTEIAATEMEQQAEPQPEEVKEATPPQQATPEPWEQRYRVLQGKYDHEVPALHNKVRDLETNFKQALEKLEAVSKAKEGIPEQAPVADPKDVEVFGAELVEMVNRIAGNSFSRAVQTVEAKFGQIEAELARLKQAMEGTNQHVAATAEQTFFDRVTKLVPGWEKVNADPAFLAWLAEADPVYGVPRQAALTKARDTLNAEHAAAVFNAFLGPRQAAPKGPDPLEKQVSPKGAATVAPTAADRSVITQAQVTKFYDEVRRGLYRGNEAEANRIEQLINLALAEGRVR